jgi:hypothetical protein
MNSKQQGQGSDKSATGKDPAQQNQSGSQNQQGGREAQQRKDFDKLMSESDQQLRDESMQQGGSDRGGKQSR